MKKLGKHEIEFPENPAEAKGWKPEISVFPLATTIIAVANTRIEGAWCAYIGVTGNSHEASIPDVRSHGAKLPESVARAMFEFYKGVPYAE